MDSSKSNNLAKSMGSIGQTKLVNSLNKTVIQKKSLIGSEIIEDNHMDLKDLNFQDKKRGRNVLHRAALNQNYALIADLIHATHQDTLNMLEIAIDSDPEMKIINSLDFYGNTPLILACVKDNKKSLLGRPKCVELLLEAGSDPNKFNKRTFWTALTWVAYYGDEKSAKSLIEKNAKAFRPDHLGYFPLDYAGNRVNILI